MNYIQSYLLWHARVTTWWANHPGYWLLMMLALVASYVLVYFGSYYQWGSKFKRKK